MTLARLRKRYGKGFYLLLTFSQSPSTDPNGSVIGAQNDFLTVPKHSGKKVPIDTTPTPRDEILLENVRTVRKQRSSLYHISENRNLVRLPSFTGMFYGYTSLIVLSSYKRFCFLLECHEIGWCSMRHMLVSLVDLLFSLMCLISKKESFHFFSHFILFY